MSADVIKKIISHQQQLPTNYSIPSDVHNKLHELDLIPYWIKADSEASKRHPGSRQDHLYFKNRIELFYEYCQKCLI